MALPHVVERLTLSPQQKIGLNTSVRPNFFAGARDDTLQWPVTALVLSLAVLLACPAFGLALDSALATQVFCGTLLIVGLPHGTFDFQILRDSANKSVMKLTMAVGLYLALAAATYGLWVVNATAALAGFLIISIIHFEEDWRDDAASDQRFLTASIPVSLISLPALSHPQDLRQIFAGLAGDIGAAALVDALILIAPVALCVALIAMTSDWLRGERGRASSALLSLLAMMILPPIAGFVVFFCVVHSPRHFRAGIQSLAEKGPSDWRQLVLPLTLGAGLVFMALFIALNRMTVTDTAIAATFMTLSVLTVPHMLAPLLLRRFQSV
jgi:beta-carotene 15,15'-dioxygenase